MFETTAITKFGTLVFFASVAVEQLRRLQETSKSRGSLFDSKSIRRNLIIENSSPLNFLEKVKNAENVKEVLVNILPKKKISKSFVVFSEDFFELLAETF